MTPRRCCSSPNFVLSLSNATISPSTTKSPPRRCAASAPAISGKVLVMLCRLRVISRTSPPSANARQRSPSSLRSKIQAGSENLSLVSVASSGSSHSGRPTLRTPPSRLVSMREGGVRRVGLPEWLDPELATLTRDRFSDPAWIFERKLDGERCLAFADGGDVRLMTRNRHNITSTFPEIAGALAAQRLGGDFVVDGEIVAFDKDQTKFGLLQHRLGVIQPSADLLAGVPAYYYLFDVLWAGDRDARPLPLLERKKILRG